MSRTLVYYTIQSVIPNLFQNLTSRQIGRVVVYSDLLSSTMAITGTGLAHGVACVARRQAAGRGRQGNVWLTPPGQAAISLQVTFFLSASMIGLHNMALDLKLSATNSWCGSSCRDVWTRPDKTLSWH